MSLENYKFIEGGQELSDELQLKIINYINLIDKQKSFLMFSSNSCMGCNILKNVIQKIIKDNEYDITYIEHNIKTQEKAFNFLQNMYLRTIPVLIIFNKIQKTISFFAHNNNKHLDQDKLNNLIILHSLNRSN